MASVSPLISRYDEFATLTEYYALWGLFVLGERDTFTNDIDDPVSTRAFTTWVPIFTLQYIGSISYFMCKEAE